MRKWIVFSVPALLLVGVTLPSHAPRATAASERSDILAASAAKDAAIPHKTIGQDASTTGASKPDVRPASVSQPTRGTTVSLAGREGCSTPANGADGGWTCPNPNARAHSQAQAAKAGISPNQGRCGLVGCWIRPTSYRAQFDGLLDYGYTQNNRYIYLGTVTLKAIDDVSGATTRVPTAYMEVNNRPSMRNAYMGAERLYTSTACPQGCAASGGRTYDRIGPETRARDVRLVWGPLNGFNIYSGYADVAYGVTVHSYAFGDPQYPGQWWAYTKGIKVQRTDGLYKYMTVDSTPTDPQKSAWRAVPVT